MVTHLVRPGASMGMPEELVKVSYELYTRVSKQPRPMLFDTSALSMISSKAKNMQNLSARINTHTDIPPTRPSACVVERARTKLRSAKTPRRSYC